MKSSYLFIAAITSLSLLSCKKDKDEKNNTPANVYLLSNEYRNSGGGSIIRYFVNGTATTIGDGSTVSIFGNDMDVSGNDVYVLARKQVASTGAQSDVIYKNGVELQSITSSNSFSPNCIAVSGNDIYLGGVGLDAGSSNYKVKLWKNGTVSNITNGTQTDSRIYDMTINGTDVYLAGYEADATTQNRIAKYWKNGTGVALPGNANDLSEIHRIVVQGSNVYCSGMINSKPTTWKNAIASPLNNAYGTCYGIAVAGNDVFAAGAVDDGTRYRAVYWKNNTQTHLDPPNNTTTTQSGVFGIAVTGNDTHVIGYIETPNGITKAVYWKNGVENDLSTTSGYNSYGYRMVVK